MNSELEHVWNWAPLLVGVGLLYPRSGLPTAQHDLTGDVAIQMVLLRVHECTISTIYVCVNCAT